MAINLSSCHGDASYGGIDLASAALQLFSFRAQRSLTAAAAAAAEDGGLLELTFQRRATSAKATLAVYMRRFVRSYFFLI